MNADGSGAGFRDWVAARLDPLETESSSDGPHCSDFDLDGGGAPTDAALTPAAVLVGLVERPGGLHVILTRRADTLRRHTGQIALPGGRCDPGETPWGAALREAREEIGLDPTLVTLAGLSTPYRTGTGYFVTPVVGFVAPGYRPDPNPDEVADVFETPFEFLMDPTNHEAKEHETPEGARRRYWAMTWDDRFIWGATAGMLRALYHRLYGGVP